MDRVEETENDTIDLQKYYDAISEAVEHAKADERATGQILLLNTDKSETYIGKDNWENNGKELQGDVLKGFVRSLKKNPRVQIYVEKELNVPNACKIRDYANFLKIPRTQREIDEFWSDTDETLKDARNIYEFEHSLQVGQQAEEWAVSFYYHSWKFWDPFKTIE